MVIFCVALSEYDQNLLEANGQNRMVESLETFKSVINSMYMKQKNVSVILFLNKTDIFKRKLAHSDLSKYFPDFQGKTGWPFSHVVLCAAGSFFSCTGDVRNELEAAKFFESKFRALNYNNVRLFCHNTCATDSDQIKTIFNVIKDQFISRNLKENGCF